MRRPTRQEQQAERERENALLHAYGYHWKRTEEELTTDQRRAACDLLAYDETLPEWTLLSPLEMPVKKRDVLCWLRKPVPADKPPFLLGEPLSPSREDKLAFLAQHGFTVLGKDEQGWHIQSPTGEILNSKQTVQALEQMRIEHALEEKRAWEQKIEEDFKHSAQSLKAILDSGGHAMNEAHAWGYSPFPTAKRLSDGRIEVTTYHFESEWQTHICQTEEEVIGYLYSDADGVWDAGEWSKE